MATTPKRKTLTAKKKTAAKPVAIKAARPSIVTAKPVAKPVAVAVTAAVIATANAPADTPENTPADAAYVLRKKELIDRVVARSGIKKKDAKPTIEAMLAVLGEALSKGEELNLHPMGKMKVTRVIEKPNAVVMVTKVRRKLEGAEGAVVKIGAES